MSKKGLYPKIIKSTEYKPINNKKGLIAVTIKGGLDLIKDLGKGVWGKR